MIAIIAAVEEETELLRAQLSPLEKTCAGGISIWNGRFRNIDLRLAHSGIGKAAAAAATVSLLSGQSAAALWLLGCGGAYPGSGLSVGDLALAEHEIFGDEGTETPCGFRSLADSKLPMRQNSEHTYYNDWPLDAGLQRWAQPLLKQHAEAGNLRLRSGAFITVSTCTGLSSHAEQIVARTEGICENMEGAAVALACNQMKVPMLELRGISNLVEDRDPGRWNLPAGMTSAQEAALYLLQHYSEQNR